MRDIRILIVLFCIIHLSSSFAHAIDAKLWEEASIIYLSHERLAKPSYITFLGIKPASDYFEALHEGYYDECKKDTDDKKIILECSNNKISQHYKVHKENSTITIIVDNPEFIPEASSFVIGSYLKNEHSETVFVGFKFRKNNIMMNDIVSRYGLRFTEIVIGSNFQKHSLVNLKRLGEYNFETRLRNNYFSKQEYLRFDFKNDGTLDEVSRISNFDPIEVEKELQKIKDKEKKKKKP